MKRKFTIVAGLLLGSISAGSLLAQTSTTTKPNPTGASTMQHSGPTTPAKAVPQDSTRAGSAGHAMRHPVWTKDQIKEAQQGLTKAGFYKGEPSGKLDRQTQQALRAYQKANKLPVTGHLNEKLLAKLHSA